MAGISTWSILLTSSEYPLLNGIHFNSKVDVVFQLAPSLYSVPDALLSEQIFSFKSGSV